ncbi:methyltransferase domain-containing protein [Desulfobacter vibrioformis]|uniref:methyltransferase domain-containing protein n=1 Tax=Desulfobacter vibrioformis TaxID=34031 RepID=UPI000553ABCD|nr:methyltransferase domain-containing protein [Desulfobacter vibrioformis]
MSNSLHSNAIPCISVVRPLSDNCLSMLKCEGEYLYPKILRELIKQNVFSQIVFSVSPDVPPRFIEIISKWGFEFDIGHDVYPHIRVAKLSKAKEWDIVCCISSYTYFFDDVFIQNQFMRVQSGEFDFAGANVALSNLEFSIINSATIDFLLSVNDQSIVPSKPQAIDRNATGRLRGTHAQHAYTKSEEFLWLMKYAGDTGSMPNQFISSFYQTHNADLWFSRQSREKYSATYFNVPGIDWLDDFVEQHFLSTIPMEKLAGQIRWFQRFENQFPASGDRYIELGFGHMPLISFLMASRFKEVIALEPFEKFEFNDQLAKSFFMQLSELFPYLSESVSSHTPSHLPRFSIHNTPLHDLDLASESVDFCTSKMVFEHVLDVASLSEEIFRVLKKGGEMLHEIGMNDHTGGSSSGIHFGFLKYSRGDWTRKWTGTNLMRINDFIKLWEEIGFKVEVVRKIVSSNIPPIIDKSWFPYKVEDLLCQTAVIKAIKQ